MILADKSGAPRKRNSFHGRAFAAGSVLCACVSTAAFADEGGVSFWVPGLYGSLAATPLQPGFTFSTTYYHTSVSAEGDVARAREVTIGRFPLNLSGSVNLQLNSAADLGFFTAIYALPTPVLGGQASVGMLGTFGRVNTSVFGTLNGALQGPGGMLVPFSRSDSIGDSVFGVGDLYPQIALRWNFGVHNFMTYATGDIPVGSYSSTRLSNIGIGHGAVDAGGGYTYFNPETGHEASGVLGFTYNFKNPSTQYQNGVDLHFDWGASQFVSKEVQIGVVGYAYKDIGCDSGSGDRVGCFRSQVLGIGPQLGFIIPLGDLQGYINFKGYKEFDAKDRAHGWNTWLTFVISPAPSHAAAAAPPSLTPPPRHSASAR
jgi:hypothetical protein